MLYMALLSTVFAFWGQAVAQTKLGPTEAAVLFCIEPVLAATLSVLWLKESMTSIQILGGALIVLAMIVAEALPADLPPDHGTRHQAVRAHLFGCSHSAYSRYHSRCHPYLSEA